MPLFAVIKFIQAIKLKLNINPNSCLNLQCFADSSRSAAQLKSGGPLVVRGYHRDLPDQYLIYLQKVVGEN